MTDRQTDGQNRHEANQTQVVRGRDRRVARDRKTDKQEEMVVRQEVSEADW